MAYQKKSIEKSSAKSNNSIGESLSEKKGISFSAVPALQRQEAEEELQMKKDPVQKVEDEEPLQGKFEPVQKVEEEEPLQGKFESPVQKKNNSIKAFQLKDNTSADSGSGTAQLEENATGNKTGMPDHLKSGIESLSGLAMDDVKV